MQRALSASLLLLIAAAGGPRADGVRPQRFGPFLQQGATLQGNPSGYRHIFPFATYNFQAGWMEPIAVLPWALFQGSYIETQGNATVTPYQTDFGIAFNLKPIRFFEFGLAYNRLFFPNTLVGFSTDTGDASLPVNYRWSPTGMWSADYRSTAGADIFTYQANITVNSGPVQLHGGTSYSLWDVDTKTHDLILEYRSGLLIKRRDRIGSTNAHILFRPDSGMGLLGFSAEGFGVRDQLWWTVQTDLSQNLVSAGFTGLRRGRNESRLYRGLDGWVGYWTWHPQLKGLEPREKFNVSLQWTWNIQILDLTDQ